VEHIEKALEQAAKRGVDEKSPAPSDETKSNAIYAPDRGLDRGVGNITYEQTATQPISSETLVANRIVSHLEQDPRSLPFDMLRTKVLKRMRDKGWRTLAICSATPGAGKSLISANLAVSMAQEGNYTVLLVDLDMKRPSIHKYFSITPEQGIESHLRDAVPLKDILINPGIPRLTILPVKERVSYSSQLLSSKAFADMLSGLESRYESRLILIDLPPLLAADDALVLADKVDASLLVIEEGKNTEEEVQDALRMLQATDVIGTVLNKSDSASSSSYYGSY